jgi:hypothetical protein
MRAAARRWGGSKSLRSVDAYADYVLAPIAPRKSALCGSVRTEINSLTSRFLMIRKGMAIQAPKLPNWLHFITRDESSLVTLILFVEVSLCIHVWIYKRTSVLGTELLRLPAHAIALFLDSMSRKRFATLPRTV